MGTILYVLRSKMVLIKKMNQHITYLLIFTLLENSTSPTYSNDTVPVSAVTPLTAPPRIKMIDTDIDDIEDIDLDIGPNDQLTRLYEEKDHELPPPSFNTAVRKDKSASNSYRHQYQNEMDLEALVKR